MKKGIARVSHSATREALGSKKGIDSELASELLECLQEHLVKLRRKPLGSRRLRVKPHEGYELS